MTAAIGKYAAKKMLRKQMAQYKNKQVAGDKDPYFAEVVNPRTGKKKKVKKQVPDYIPEQDALILAKVRSRAYKLDMCLFNFLGIRFGWSSVVGIIPMIGDALDLALAYLLVQKCRQVKCGLASGVVMMMWLNILLDFGIGLIPFIGDLVDASFKANTRNLRLLEKELDKAYKPKAQQDAEELMRPEDRPQPATVYEDFSDEESGRRGSPPAYDGHHNDVSVPAPARVPTERRGGEPPARSGSKLKKSGSSSQRQPDIEMSQTRNGNSPLPSRSGTQGSARR